MQMTQQVGKDWFESAASFHFKTKRNELMQRRGMNVERTREPNEPNRTERNRTEPNERNTNLRLRVVVVVVVCKGHDTVAFARLPLRLLRAAFVAKLFSVFLFRILASSIVRSKHWLPAHKFELHGQLCSSCCLLAPGWFRQGGCEINTTCMRLLGNAASLCVSLCVCGACGWDLAKMT